MSVLTRDQIAEEIERWIDADRSRDADTSGLRELITAGLDLDYVSESCRGGIQTGNHYQSVRLGDTVTAGFRGDRAGVLDRIDFRGRTVLDLGSNLGELSRGARERGAARVVGVEYDRFFVALARGLNVLNEVEGVEFRQGDIGNPEFYGEHFDIVMAFSVFQYVGGLIGTVCDIADELLVIETHKLEGNLASDYVGPVASYLPSFRMLGRSDWGSTFDEPGERAVLAFARDDDGLTERLGPVHETRSRAQRVESARVDVHRTSHELQERFFTHFAFDNAHELFEAVRTTSLDLDVMAGNREVDEGYRGWLYWFMYLKGYLEYLERAVVDTENAFWQYFTRYHLPRAQEPGIRVEEAGTIVARRYRDLDTMRAAPAASGDLGPLRITISDPLPPYPLLISFTSGESLRGSLLDGWHRLFAAEICGTPELEAELVYEQYPRAHGRVEYYGEADGRLRLEGWSLSPKEPWDFIELRADGGPLARVPPVERADVADGVPDTPHALASGFSFDCDAPPADCLTLDLLLMRDWLPIGRMRLYRSPGAGPESLGVATGLGEALETVKPVLQPEGAVLAVGPLAGAVVTSLLSPDVYLVEGDPADWSAQDDTARLIVVGNALAVVPESERYAWLESAARCLRSGGLLVLGDRGWMPSDLPPRLRHLLRLPPEPVDSAETVVLLRA